MELFLIRHGRMTGDPHREYGQAPANLRGCLSQEGEREAAALAEALAGVRFDRVFASTLGRAIQTAEPIARQSGVGVEVLRWLVEWRPATVLGECDVAEYEALQAAARERRPEESWKTPAGEGTLEMAHRVITGFLETIRGLGVRAGHGGYLLDDPDDARRIAMVAHGGSLGMLAGFLLGVTLRPHGPVAFEHVGMAVFSFHRRVDVWYPNLRIAPPFAADVASTAVVNEAASQTR